MKSTFHDCRMCGSTRAKCVVTKRWRSCATEQLRVKLERWSLLKGRRDKLGGSVVHDAQILTNISRLVRRSWTNKLPATHADTILSESHLTI